MTRRKRRVTVPERGACSLPVSLVYGDPVSLLTEKGRKIIRFSQGEAGETGDPWKKRVFSCLLETEVCASRRSCHFNLTSGEPAALILVCYLLRRAPRDAHLLSRRSEPVDARRSDEEPRAFRRGRQGAIPRRLLVVHPHKVPPQERNRRRGDGTRPGHRTNEGGTENETQRLRRLTRPLPRGIGRRRMDSEGGDRVFDRVRAETSTF